MKVSSQIVLEKEEAKDLLECLLYVAGEKEFHDMKDRELRMKTLGVTVADLEEKIITMETGQWPARTHKEWFKRKEEFAKNIDKMICPFTPD